MLVLKNLLLLFLGVLVLGCKSAMAQYGSEEKENRTKAVWLQYNPLNVAEPDIIVAATLLKRMNTYWAWALDAGVYVGRQNYNDEYFAQSGFRLRPELRHYFHGGKLDKSSTIYVAFQGLIKFTASPTQKWVNELDANGNLLFSRLANYKQNRWVLGFNANFGIEALLDKKGKWMMDIFGGGGFRHKQFSASGLPPEQQPNFNQNENERAFNIYLNGWYPSLTLGLKISYRLR